MSYSQRGEEAAILKACEHLTPGRFLDIGAWQPKDKSNTRALFELGWGGLCIEPSPVPLRALVEEYGNEARMQALCAAVALEPGFIELQLTDDALSTPPDSEQAKVWAETGGFYGRCLFPAITIPEILIRFGAFGFVSIDTEGSSVDLLKVLMSTEMKPQCVCVEHDQRIEEAIRCSQDAGYRMILMTEENLVFSL